MVVVLFIETRPGTVFARLRTPYKNSLGPFRCTSSRVTSKHVREIFKKFKIFVWQYFVSSCVYFSGCRGRVTAASRLTVSMSELISITSLNTSLARKSEHRFSKDTGLLSVLSNDIIFFAIFRLDSDEEETERHCNYERYKILAQNDCAGGNKISLTTSKPHNSTRNFGQKMSCVFLL